MPPRSMTMEEKEERKQEWRRRRLRNQGAAPSEPAPFGQDGGGSEAPAPAPQMISQPPLLGQQPIRMQQGLGGGSSYGGNTPPARGGLLAQRRQQQPEARRRGEPEYPPDNSDLSSPNDWRDVMPDPANARGGRVKPKAPFFTEDTPVQTAGRPMISMAAAKAIHHVPPLQSLQSLNAPAPREEEVGFERRSISAESGIYELGPVVPLKSTRAMALPSRSGGGVNGLDIVQGSDFRLLLQKAVHQEQLLKNEASERFKLEADLAIVREKQALLTTDVVSKIGAVERLARQDDTQRLVMELLKERDTLNKRLDSIESSVRNDRRDLERIPSAIEEREEANIHALKAEQRHAMSDVELTLREVGDQAKVNRDMQMRLEQQLRQQQMAADQLRLQLAGQSSEQEKNAAKQSSAIHEAGVQTMLVSEQHSNVEVTLAGRIEMLEQRLRDEQRTRADASESANQALKNKASELFGLVRAEEEARSVGVKTVEGELAKDSASWQQTVGKVQAELSSYIATAMQTITDNHSETGNSLKSLAAEYTSQHAQLDTVLRTEIQSRLAHEKVSNAAQEKAVHEATTTQLKALIEAKAALHGEIEEARSSSEASAAQLTMAVSELEKKLGQETDSRLKAQNYMYGRITELESKLTSEEEQREEASVALQAMVAGAKEEALRFVQESRSKLEEALRTEADDRAVAVRRNTFGLERLREELASQEEEAQRAAEVHDVMQGLLGAVEAGQEEVERQAALSLQLAKDREGERRLLSVRSELAERMDTGLLLVDGKVTAVEAALDEETSSRAASNMMSMVKTTGLIEEAEARRVSGDKSLQAALDGVSDRVEALKDTGVHGAIGELQRLIGEETSSRTASVMGLQMALDGSVEMADKDRADSLAGDAAAGLAAKALAADTAAALVAHSAAERAALKDALTDNEVNACMQHMIEAVEAEVFDDFAAAADREARRQTDARLDTLDVGVASLGEKTAGADASLGQRLDELSSLTSATDDKLTSDLAAERAEREAEAAALKEADRLAEERHEEEVSSRVASVTGVSLTLNSEIAQQEQARVDAVAVLAQADADAENRLNAQHTSLDASVTLRHNDLDTQYKAAHAELDERLNAKQDAAAAAAKSSADESTAAHKKDVGAQYAALRSATEAKCDATRLAAATTEDQLQQEVIARATTVSSEVANRKAEMALSEQRLQKTMAMLVHMESEPLKRITKRTEARVLVTEKQIATLEGVKAEEAQVDRAQQQLREVEEELKILEAKAAAKTKALDEQVKALYAKAKVLEDVEADRRLREVEDKQEANRAAAEGRLKELESVKAAERLMEAEAKLTGVETAAAESKRTAEERLVVLEAHLAKLDGDGKALESRTDASQKTNEERLVTAEAQVARIDGLESGLSAVEGSASETKATVVERLDSLEEKLGLAGDRADELSKKVDDTDVKSKETEAKVDSLEKSASSEAAARSRSDAEDARVKAEQENAAAAEADDQAKAAKAAKDKTADDDDDDGGRDGASAAADDDAAAGDDDVPAAVADDAKKDDEDKADDVKTALEEDDQDDSKKKKKKKDKKKVDK